jgi:hypothetical protein
MGGERGGEKKKTKKKKKKVRKKQAPSTIAFIPQPRLFTAAGIFARISLRALSKHGKARVRRREQEKFVRRCEQRRRAPRTPQHFVRFEDTFYLFF